ncbi:methyl-accepting chemotaxis protein [Paracidovorax citrulli]|uniref:Methyl-accepting chemotaxis protein n=1 Tax=Paracidovorax citrulli TaxID=80869 RepID=A0ABY9ALR8_PARCI|nr:methyl-accepting chemotaxis protein [Paracidovorax citrulli]PVY66124.1 methyl-accepting chemotaxis sensory transducer with TarH sensor [Paracidovorax citrulli]QCX11867.1 Methyl-accepting chemotaxis protein III [Paracidovorax citrulli]REG69703.1 methyl-accepting chemotaxis protein [Paracidovorax citrulli]RLJ94257.1 methyl-accepting chemotaxis protein [Paracidovorax citrulli]WIY28181.1 methyl-accepting chemotaxis protein [Paracidovorax citrulli]
MKDLKIATRLALGFALILLVMFVMNMLGLTNMGETVRSVKGVASESLVKERLISDWARNIHTSVQRTKAVARSSDTSLNDAFAEEAAASSRQSADMLKRIEALLQADQEKALMADIQKARTNYLTSRDAIYKAKREGRLEDAQRLFTQEFQPITAQFLEAVQKLLNMQRENIDASLGQVESGYAETRSAVAIATVLALILGGGLGWWITRGITRPLGEAVRVARAVADNDLTSAIAAGGRDETGQVLDALRQMNDNLAQVTGRVRQGADSIAIAAREIDAGNQDLSARTERQASALQQTAASIEQLTSAVRQNADSARQANQLAAHASQMAGEGGQVVAGVVQTMGAIDASSRRIADIIGVIDGIAFQTNILALNAAVEAARAGEQGRGFAVVAGEVRALAGRSAEAAKDIKTLIGDSVAKVDEGSQQVAQAGRTMETVVDSIRRVADIMGEISAASAEQSSGIEQVSQAIGQMDQVTQQNAALVEEAAAAAGSLKTQAAMLAEVVSAFRLRDGSAAGMPAAAAPVAPPIAKAVPPAAVPAPQAPARAAVAAPVRPRPPATVGAAGGKAPALPGRPPAGASAPPASAPPASAPRPPAPSRKASQSDDDWETF